MAGFSQDIPPSSHHLHSTSPQLIFQRLSTTSTNSLSPSSSSTEMDIMRNRVLQMQTLAMTEKEVTFDFSRNNKFTFLKSSHQNIGVEKQKIIVE
jgi:hypothetical protein